VFGGATKIVESENFKQKKKSSKKSVVQVFYSKSRGKIFSREGKKHVEEKQEFNIKKSLYVRSHIECENRNSAVSETVVYIKEVDFIQV